MSSQTIITSGERDALANHGAQSIAQGSKSFALASRLFGEEMRADVQMLYAWCRYCDDVIDGQSFGEDAPDIELTAEEQSRRLDKLQKLTRKALNGEKTGNPAFDGFSIVARKHKIPEQYPLDLLNGFSMDVSSRHYETMNECLEYCYGVAGCVGIMMAIVMGVSPEDHETLDRASDLGLGFQLTNICRDIIDDAKADRIYLPAHMLEKHKIAVLPNSVLDNKNRGQLSLAANEILSIADDYYSSAGEGLKKLPPRAAGAIAAARNIYREIGSIIRTRGSHAWDDRAYTSKMKKTWLAMSGLLSGGVQPVFRSNQKPLRRDQNLWQRPVNGARLFVKGEA